MTEGGGYWVKWFPGSDWIPAYWDSESFESLASIGDNPFIVGPKIEEPKEAKS